jgi:hypothetical protein
MLELMMVKLPLQTDELGEDVPNEVLRKLSVKSVMSVQTVAFSLTKGLLCPSPA